MRKILVLVFLLSLSSNAFAIRYESFDPQTGKLLESKELPDDFLKETRNKENKRSRAKFSAVKVLDNGASKNRLDLVIMGDGYTSSELDTFANDVQTVIDEIFRNQDGLEEFWYAYRDSMNVWKIDVTSNESGASHRETDPQVTKDTALGTYYGCQGVDRLICYDSSSVNAVLKDSIANNAKDIVMILVNDPAFGGSGGQYSVSSTTGSFTRTMLHEIGHSFANLADEYVDVNLCNQNGAEPNLKNATKETNRTDIKWARWIEDSTTIPSIDETAGIIGLYEGSHYCANDFYRPSFDSMMRTTAKPFEAVNNEQLIRFFYKDYADPIDSFSPEDTSLSTTDGTTINFSVSTLPRPTTNPMQIQWFVDDNLITDQNNSESFTYDPTIFATSETGSNKIKVTVTDTSNRVRAAAIQDLMEESQSWTVKYKTGGSQDPDKNDNGSTLEGNLADLAIKVKARKKPVKFDKEFKLKVIVKNKKSKKFKSSPSSDVVVTATIPEDLELGSLAEQLCELDENQLMTCELGNIAVNKTAAITISFKAKEVFDDDFFDDEDFSIQKSIIDDFRVFSNTEDESLKTTDPKEKNNSPKKPIKIKFR